MFFFFETKLTADVQSQIKSQSGYIICSIVNYLVKLIIGMVSHCHRLDLLRRLLTKMKLILTKTRFAIPGFRIRWFRSLFFLFHFCLLPFTQVFLLRLNSQVTDFIFASKVYLSLISLYILIIYYSKLQREVSLKIKNAGF